MTTPTLNLNTLLVDQNLWHSKLLWRAHTGRVLKETTLRKRNIGSRRLRPLTNAVALFGEMLGKKYWSLWP